MENNRIKTLYYGLGTQWEIDTKCKECMETIEKIGKIRQYIKDIGLYNELKIRFRFSSHGYQCSECRQRKWEKSVKSQFRLSSEKEN